MAGRSLTPAGRIIAFSDGVVAIAITVLLLPLADLELPESGLVTDLISGNSQLILSLVLSWVIIATFWLAHHRVFESVARVDGVVLWLNLGWLFTIVLLPLPTSLVEQDTNRQTVVFYVGTMWAISALLAVISYRVRRHPDMMESWAHRSQDMTRGELRGRLIAAWFGVVTIAALMLEGAALYLLLALFVVTPVVNLIADRRGIPKDVVGPREPQE